MYKKIAVILLILFLSVGISFAGGKATKKECIQKCRQAAAMVTKEGLSKTLKVVNDKKGPFVWKDTYVFTVDTVKETVLAHPAKPGLIGKKLLLLKDIRGKLFFAEFINVAKTKGSGWVEYMWPKPGGRKPFPKMTYVYKVKGMNVLMAAGIYK